MPPSDRPRLWRCPALLHCRPKQGIPSVPTIPSCFQSNQAVRSPDSSKTPCLVTSLAPPSSASCL
eukprot:scaffold226690_cov17-Tisochrysis_lutea.AAC.1